ncbi:MAG TPA: ATP-binding protein [Methanomicrobiales archaeon]|jgi:DNA helicase HerA-like ATPase|nr:ATP-binding protein [Methanomicrobiales archaeon]
MTNLHDTDLSDPSKFRLIGNSVLSYRFAIPYDEILYVGNILKIEDRTKGMTFFARVTDLRHGSNFDDEKWDMRAHAERFYGLSEDVYLIVEALPLGYVDVKGTFRRPRTLPTKFSPVLVPSAPDFRFLQQVMGDIEVGSLKSGQEVLREVRVALHARVMPQHMGVFATTGMGKSNFMKVFCASSMQARKFGLVLVDPHGEYVAGGVSAAGQPTEGLAHFQSGRDGLSVYTIREESFRRRYSLSTLFLEYDDLRAPDLLLLFDHSPAQRELVEMLEDVPGSELVDLFTDTEFDEEKAWMATTPYRSTAARLAQFQPSTLQVMKRRVGILVKSNPFLRPRGSSVPDILADLAENRVVLVDIPGMGERSELLVLSVLARKILERHRGEASGWGKPDAPGRSEVLITIEEAQRVLGSGGQGTAVFRECAMEGRKFGVGLCVVTQQPRNIDPRVLAQMNTFVVMGLSDRNDRAIIAGHAKQDLSPMDTEIQTLEPGEAIISTLGIPFPVSTRIHLYEEYLAGLEGKKGRSLGSGLDSRF